MITHDLNYTFLLLIVCLFFVLCFFFFNDTATTEIYTLSLHDALPISRLQSAEQLLDAVCDVTGVPERYAGHVARSEEHTSELQSRQYLVCRLLLEKKKKTKRIMKKKKIKDDVYKK